VIAGHRRRGRQREAPLTFGTGIEEDEVLNQPPPLAEYNTYLTDRPLDEAVARESAGWAQAQLEVFGKTVGSAMAIE
jgi:hypothetical protein